MAEELPEPRRTEARPPRSWRGVSGLAVAAAFVVASCAVSPSRTQSPTPPSPAPSSPGSGPPFVFPEPAQERSERALIELYTGVAGSPAFRPEGGESLATELVLGGTFILPAYDRIWAGFSGSFQSTDTRQTQFYGGAIAGLRPSLGYRLRPELFVELGAHQVRRLVVENDLTKSTVFHRNVVRPYAGLRIGTAVELNRNFAVSLTATARRDLITGTEVLMDCVPNCIEKAWQVGGTFLMGQLALQAIFD